MKKNRRNLEQLDFGPPAAERDILSGLQNYFVESQSYRRLKKGGKSILLGNRGTGKSAIFRVLAAHYRQQGYVVIELTPEDYSYEMLSRTLTEEHKGAWAKVGAYTASWKYLIYVLIMARILDKAPNLKKREAKEIYKFLRDNHQGFQNSPLEILISYLKRFDQLKLGLLDASIKVRKLQTLYKLEEISRLLPILETVCAHIPVAVFVDELDRGWDASEDAKAFVSGLFQAAMSINQTIQNTRVMISLRQEMYNSIPTLYEDAQKVWDLIEVIRWDKLSLLGLIAKRIAYSFTELHEKSANQCWNTVFASGNSVESFDYLIDRTLYRPREIIQFCIQATELAIERREFPISFESVKEVESLYSEHRTKDIAAEYRFQYPELLKVFEAFRGRPHTLERTVLEEICLEIILTEMTGTHGVQWLQDQEPEFLITILWEIGFLRAQVKGNAGNGGPTFLGSHEISTLNLKSVDRFDIHPMFRANLGMESSA
ncbi:MAG: P-loop ATPase, Sll1717 family [bacterium]